MKLSALDWAILYDTLYSSLSFVERDDGYPWAYTKAAREAVAKKILQGLTDMMTEITVDPLDKCPEGT